MDGYFTCECLLCMLGCERVCWVPDMMIYSLAYPFVCLCVMRGLFLCNDHQPCWCEQMWEPLAVVKLIGMLQLDGLDGIGPTVGPIAGVLLLVMTFLVWTRPSMIICLSNIFLFGPCGAFFLVTWVYLMYCIPLYPKPRTLWIFMYVMFY